MPHFVRDVEDIRQRAIHKIEDGAVTGGYRGDVQHTVDILNEALATEIVCVLRYMHHYFMATGVHGRSVADEFKEHADAEREHADRIAERIQQLGGKPDFSPGTLLQRSVSQYVEGESLADMIREDLIAERVVIEVYQEMIRYFGENDPTTRRLVEKILEDEEEHASDLADLLYIVDPQSAETRGQDPDTLSLPLRSEQEYAAKETGGVERQADTSVHAAAGEDSREEDINMTSDSEKTSPPKDVHDRQRTEQFAGRGSAVPAKRGMAVSQNPSEKADDRAAGAQASRNEGELRPARASRGKPGAGYGGGPAEVEAPASNIGGVSGRTMNRRQDTDRRDEGAANEKSLEGAQGGATRSVRLTNKSRKSKGKRVA